MLSTGDIWLPKDFQSSVNKVSRELKKEQNSLYNCINSIVHDASFVEEISLLYPNVPVYANLRCGLWYVRDPKNTCYFKSTDGHYGNWSFSVSRLNLHVVKALAQHHGVIIVDATRKGKRFPDAFNKTIPIWCAVVNRAAAMLRNPSFPVSSNTMSNSSAFPASSSPSLSSAPPLPPLPSDWDLDLHLPLWISKNEHNRVQSLIDSWARSLILTANDFPEIATLLSKPLRPLWISPTSRIWTDSVAQPSELPFAPVVLLSASQPLSYERKLLTHFGGNRDGGHRNRAGDVVNGVTDKGKSGHNDEDDDRENDDDDYSSDHRNGHRNLQRDTYVYVPGAGDDEESWALGLSPKLLWDYQDDLLAAGPVGITSLVQQLVSGCNHSQRSPLPPLGANDPSMGEEGNSNSLTSESIPSNSLCHDGARPNIQVSSPPPPPNLASAPSSKGNKAGRPAATFTQPQTDQHHLRPKGCCFIDDGDQSDGVEGGSGEGRGGGKGGEFERKVTQLFGSRLESSDPKGNRFDSLNRDQTSKEVNFRDFSGIFFIKGSGIAIGSTRALNLDRIEKKVDAVLDLSMDPESSPMKTLILQYDKRRRPNSTDPRNAHDEWNEEQRSEESMMGKRVPVNETEDEHHSLVFPAVSIPVKSCKVSRDGLLTELGRALIFCEEHVTRGRHVLLVDESGLDSSVCVAVALLIASYLHSSNEKIDKTVVRKCLAYVSSYYPQARPTRGMLKQVFNFFFNASNEDTELVRKTN